MRIYQFAGRIKCLIYKWLYRFAHRLFALSVNSGHSKQRPNPDYDELFSNYRTFVNKNKYRKPVIYEKKLYEANREGGFVGAAMAGDICVLIPNSSEEVICYDRISGRTESFGKLGKQPFKWTGGGSFQSVVYGFLRTSNQLLKIKVNEMSAEAIDLGLHYKKEHHYGGAITANGMIYQPPRNENHILVIDTSNYDTRKIYLFPKWTKIKAKYCGSVLHPNGYLYFLPEENERVIKFDPATETIYYIGQEIDSMVFQGAIAADGNIYGFSAYRKGILKIDVKTDKVSMICKDIKPGCYGTKAGVNGKLYGIPGDGLSFWEFDYSTQSVKEIGITEDYGNAKCAGGAADRYGNLYAAPAFNNKMYIWDFGMDKEIDSLLYDTFFTDFY